MALNLAVTVAAGASERRALGFNARGVVLDNGSNGWIYVPAVDQFVPPYIFGYSAPFPIDVRVGEIRSQAPPGQTQPTTFTGQVVARFQDSPTGASPGTLITPASSTTALGIPAGGVGAVIIGGGTITPVIPAVAAPGDLLVMISFATQESASGLLPAPNTPAGWTLRTGNSAANAATNALALQVWTRPMVAGAANPTIAWTNVSGTAQAVIIVVNNPNTTTPFVNGQSSNTVAAVATLTLGTAPTGSSLGAIMFTASGMLINAGPVPLLTAFTPAGGTTDVLDSLGGATARFEVEHVGLTASGSGPTKTVTYAGNGNGIELISFIIAPL